MKKLIAVFMTCLLIASACPVNLNAATSKPSPAIQALAAVLQNKATFFSTDDGKTILLSDIGFFRFGIAEQTDGAAVKPYRFAIVDLDGDRIPEVVLGLECGYYTDLYEFLRYVGGKVYGYSFTYGNLYDIAKDGTIFYADGRADGMMGNVRFMGATMDFRVRADWDDPYFDPDDPDTSMPNYYINDFPVDKKTFNQILYMSRDNVDWYACTNDNIATWVLNQPNSLVSKPSLPQTALTGRQKYLDSLEYVTNTRNAWDVNYSKNIDNSEQAALARKYYQDADTELNKIYQMLAKKLPTADMAKLRADERAWIKARDRKAVLTDYAISSYTATYAKELHNISLGSVTINRVYRLVDLYYGFEKIADFSEGVQR